MKDSDLLQALAQNPFVLAPMAGITDRPFRSFMREMGCGIVVSELVSATGLKYSSSKTLKLMEFTTDQHPVGIQLFGENNEHLSDAAKIVEQMGADFVDLNFGCPVAKVVSKGAGSACLKDLLKLRDVIRSTKSGIQIPLTIKIRTGWDESSRNSPEVARIAFDEGVTWVAIHGRTRSAAYTGNADWNYIAEVKRSSPLPIIGNGDVVSSEMANRRRLESGCDGLMIGRGCLKNPSIFRQANGHADTSNRRLWDTVGRLRLHLESFYDERLTALQLRKFASWYSTGYPGATQFRKDLFSLDGLDRVWARIEGFFRDIEGQVQDVAFNEAFLAGGHG